MDDYRLSGYLFRASLARFEFDRPPRLYCDPRFGPVERHLLEVHEHNHWSLAHASLFGISQLSLAYALLLAQSEEQKTCYRECLQITTDLSREVYEGCAVYHEKAFVRRHGARVDDEWFAPLEGSVYGSGFELFDSFLSSLPFGDVLKASIATNVAELVLKLWVEAVWKVGRRAISGVLQPSPMSRSSILSRSERPVFRARCVATTFHTASVAA